MDGRNSGAPYHKGRQGPVDARMATQCQGTGGIQPLIGALHTETVPKRYRIRRIRGPIGTIR